MSFTVYMHVFMNTSSTNRIWHIFLLLDWLTKAREPSLPYSLPIAEEKIDVFVLCFFKCTYDYNETLRKESNFSIRLLIRSWYAIKQIN